MLETVINLFDNNEDQPSSEDEEDNEVFKSDTNSEVQDSDRIDKIEKKLDEVVNQAERTESKMTRMEDQVSNLESKTESVDDRTTNLMDMYDEFMADSNPLIDQDDSTTSEAENITDKAKEKNESESVFSSSLEEESPRNSDIVVADNVYPVDNLSDYTPLVIYLRVVESYGLRDQVLEKLVQQGFITNQLSEELQLRLDDRSIHTEEVTKEMNELRTDMLFEQITTVIAEESSENEWDI